jgi:excinuclease ABC subunit C
VPLLVSKLPKKEVMKSSELGKDVIRKELPLIPKSPGVYRMLDHKDVILYVGKKPSQ